MALLPECGKCGTLWLNREAAIRGDKARKTSLERERDEAKEHVVKLEAEVKRLTEARQNASREAMQAEARVAELEGAVQDMRALAKEAKGDKIMLARRIADVGYNVLKGAGNG